VKSLLRLVTSTKTTVVLLCLLALLLLLNVVVPQASVLGESAIAELADASAWNHFVLITLGLGRMPTSPVFLTALGIFFLQLAIVLVDRSGPTWRRIRMRPRSKEGLEAWARLEEGKSGPLPENWDLGVAARTLQGYGYRVRRVDEKTLWGIKHRTAPLGFLLFHLSFFLLCAAGVLIYYTRFVGTAVLTEGQEFSGSYETVLRKPPHGEAPSPVFTLEAVEARFERAEPVQLAARILFQHAGGMVEKTARVNHPAEWGPVRVLVQKAGITPVLWLQDRHGFTIDRVAVAAKTRGDKPTEVPLAGGRLVAEIQPLAPEQDFPGRDELAATSLTIRVRRVAESTPLFEGVLRQGEAAPLGGGRLVLEELRYWAGVLIVSERGGGLLIAGFLTGVWGLVWRLVLYRREVALVWDQSKFRLVGRSESYPFRFGEELETIAETLKRGRLGSDVSPSALETAARPQGERSQV
jgi:hypothetical protein